MSQVFDAYHSALRREVAFAVRRVTRSLGLPQDQVDDLRQDLFLALVERLSAFDARRSRITTFAAMIIRQRAATWVRRRRADRMRVLVIVDTAGLDAEDGLASVERYGQPGIEAAELALDVRAVLERLPASLRLLCEQIGVLPVTAIAAHQNRSRSTVHREIRQVRRLLTAAGLDEYVAFSARRRESNR